MPDFADLLARKNAAVIDHLSTATVTARGVSPFRAIFQREYVESQGIEGFRPTITCHECEARGVRHVDQVLVDGGLYRVIGREPDGAGLVRIILEVSA